MLTDFQGDYLKNNNVRCACLLRSPLIGFPHCIGMLTCISKDAPPHILSAGVQSRFFWVSALLTDLPKVFKIKAFYVTLQPMGTVRDTCSRKSWGMYAFYQWM